MTDLKGSPSNIKKSRENSIIGILSTAIVRGLKALVDGDVAREDEDESKNIPGSSLACD